MKTITFIFFTILLGTSYSQDLLFNEKQKLKVTPAVFEDSTLSKMQMHGRNKSFIAEIFKSANDVIQSDDVEIGMLIAKGFSDIYLQGPIGVVKEKMFYTLKLQSKEGRARMSIINVYYETYATSAMPAKISYPADWFSSIELYKKNGKERKMQASYRDETMQKISDLNKLFLKYEVNSNDSEDSDDW